VAGDPRRHDGRIVDYDCQTGVAVLKVDQVSNLPTLGFGDSAALKVGQNVVAVGGPLAGVQRSVVSALHRSLLLDGRLVGVAGQLTDLTATDNALDPALAGGPLLNVGGQVVGITMVASSGGRTASFALAAAGLQPEVEQIVQSGQLQVASLGAEVTDVSPEVAALRGGTPGSLVTAVAAGSPADLAGIRRGDVLTALEDQKLDPAHPLTELLRTRYRPGQRITVTYSRGGGSNQVQLTLGGEHPRCS
jgi:S1-C subfamily serine protease